jgi:hypothetical protein
MRALAKAAFALLLAWPAIGAAHPLAPALLELRASTAERYEVRWLTSVARVRGVEVAPVLPARCRTLGTPRTALRGGEAVESTWAVQCDGGLAGGTIHVDGLDGSGIQVVLRIEAAGAPAVSAILDARAPAFAVPRQPTAGARWLAYGVLGVEHLLGGLDHVLFVVGLLGVVRGARKLVVAITAFTLGHSLTLAAATLGVVRVDPALTELGIALSLVAVALGMLRPHDAPGLIARHPGALTLAFGLLHGLGFAGVLGGMALEQDAIVAALLAFNLGIEAGQLAVVAAALALARLARDVAWSQWTISRLAPAYMIGSLAACWCLERTAALLA